MPEIQGGCRCGAVRYELALDALPSTYACHCLDCQTWSGSAFSQQTFLPEAALSVSGPVVVYEFTTPSGRTSTQRLCAVCHARIYNTNSARPNVADRARRHAGSQQRAPCRRSHLGEAEAALADVARGCADLARVGPRDRAAAGLAQC